MGFKLVSIVVRALVPKLDQIELYFFFVSGLVIFFASILLPITDPKKL